LASGTNGEGLGQAIEALALGMVVDMLAPQLSLIWTGLLWRVQRHDLTRAISFILVRGLLPADHRQESQSPAGRRSVNALNNTGGLHSQFLKGGWDAHILRRGRAPARAPG
jgi:hypothetical protein